MVLYQNLTHGYSTQTVHFYYGPVFVLSFILNSEGNARIPLEDEYF